MTVTPEMFGAQCDGVCDDGPAIQAALNASQYVELTTGKTYYPRSTIFMPSSRSVLEGDASIFVDKAYFNNNNPYKAGDARIASVNAGAGGWNLNQAGRYGASAVVLAITGSQTAGGPRNVGSKVRGIRFIGDAGPGLVRNVIFAKNTEDLEISECSITGFGMGYGILLGGCKNYSLLRNKIYDCIETGIYPATACGDAANCAPNVTAIGTTDDFMADFGVSTYGTIADNRIDNIHFAGAGLSRHGDQSDGINLAQMAQTSLVQITGNKISSVAEGMDIFEKFCQINGNTLVSCGVFGLKFIYGASFNTINGNTVLNSGAAAMVFDSPSGYETRSNTGVGNVLYNAKSANPVYDDNGLIQLSSSGSGSTHSNSITGGNYAAVDAKTYIRNTANVGSNPNNTVGGRFNGPGKHSDPNQQYCSHSSAGFAWAAA